MATTQERTATAGTVYTLEGTLLEACSCGILCPCWVGEDPDEEACYAFNAYHFTAGAVNDIDVAGCNYVRIVEIPGNVLTPASWRQVVFIDEGATKQQQDALIAAFAGELGGPLADLAGLIGETTAIKRARIEHEISGGTGTIRIDGVLEATMEPYRGAGDTITTLRDSLFSTVPGSPAWVGKASTHKVTLSEFGMEWEYTNRNAIQSEYRIEFSR